MKNLKTFMSYMTVISFNIVLLLPGFSQAAEPVLSSDDQPNAAESSQNVHELLPKSRVSAARSVKVLYSNDEETAERYYKDLDEDAVQDRIDHCLNTALEIAVEQRVDNRGCELDSDQDGVFDRFDYCPETPKGIAVNFLGCEGDEDRDGVLDSKDLCPGTPYGTVVDEHGCKAPQDSDGDGIYDENDLCPNTPKGAKVNRYGCQPRKKVIVNIVFNTGSYEIRADQKSILEKQASQLAELKPGEVLLVTGFTDNRSCEEGNLKLSWKRAQSTKDFLVKRLNLNPSKIYVRGEGSAHPIASNDTPEGRQKNRRIELEIVPEDALPIKAKPVIPEKMSDYVRGYCRKHGIVVKH